MAPRKTPQSLIEDAMEGDIHAFQQLFGTFQNQLTSYLFRLTARRADAEDLTHDAFIRAFDKLHTYQGESSLKTWVFTLATNLARNFLNRRRRWTEDVSAQAKDLVMNRPDLAQAIVHTAQTSAYGRYEIKEHIDTCFTCISKTLPIENQVALMLKDVYDFSVKEIMAIMGKTEGTVKYLLQHARSKMSDIFDRRCALVNKNGICHQCSELNGWLNPKQHQQEALMKVKMVKASAKHDRASLFAMRTQLVKAIDPLRSAGNELQEVLMECNRKAMGEKD